jgi:hypothetical protein
MPTATADPQTETVTFISRSPNQVCTRRPTRYIMLPTGQRTEQTQEDWIRAEREKNEQREISKLPPLDIDKSPWKVEFQNSVYTTEDPVIIEFLRTHWLFQHPKGFWEQGAAPDEPQPTMSEQTSRIARASVGFDTEDLEKLITEEKQLHNRPAVIMGAEAAIDEVEKLKAEIGSSASEDDDGATGESGSTDD